MNTFLKFLLVATISALFLCNVVIAKEASIRALAVTKSPTKATTKAPTKATTKAPTKATTKAPIKAPTPVVKPPTPVVKPPTPVIVMATKAPMKVP